MKKTNKKQKTTFVFQPDQWNNYHKNHLKDLNNQSSSLLPDESNESNSSLKERPMRFLKNGSRNSNKKIIKSKKFFQKAEKNFHKEAIKRIDNLHKKDNLNKVIEKTFVLEDSFIAESIRDISREVLVNLKCIANNNSKLLEEINSKTTGLVNCIIKTADTKCLSKKQRNYLNVLKSYAEDITIQTTDILNIVESCVNQHVFSELHKFFKTKKKELYELKNNYVAISENISNKDIVPSHIVNKYKYIKKDLNKAFFDKLKEGIKGNPKIRSKK